MSVPGNPLTHQARILVYPKGFERPKLCRNQTLRACRRGKGTLWLMADKTERARKIRRKGVALIANREERAVRSEGLSDLQTPDCSRAFMIFSVLRLAAVTTKHIKD